MSGYLSQLTKDDLQYISDIFTKADKDANGHVTRSELQKYLEKEVIPSIEDSEKKHFKTHKKELIDFYLKYLDIDQNKTIEFTEFAHMYVYVEYHEKPNKTQMEQMFRGIDRNNDGKISFNELRIFCKMFPAKHSTDFSINKDVNVIMRKMDTNGDKRISYQEFVGNYCHL